MRLVKRSGRCNTSFHSCGDNATSGVGRSAFDDDFDWHDDGRRHDIYEYDDCFADLDIATFRSALLLLFTWYGVRQKSFDVLGWDCGNTSSPVGCGRDTWK